jgi:hypothetical protein
MRTQRGHGIVNVTDGTVKITREQVPISLKDGLKRVVSFDKVGQEVTYQGKLYRMYEWWRDDTVPVGSRIMGFNSAVFDGTEIIETAKHEVIPPPPTDEERLDKALPQVDDMSKIIFESVFEIINRVIVLEGGNQITRAQLRTWMKNKL